MAEVIQPLTLDGLSGRYHEVSHFPGYMTMCKRLSLHSWLRQKAIVLGCWPRSGCDPVTVGVGMVTSLSKYDWDPRRGARHKSVAQQDTFLVLGAWECARGKFFAMGR